MLSLRNDDLLIGEIDTDHEIEIVIQTAPKAQSVWINAAMAQEIINHFKEQFGI